MNDKINLCEILKDCPKGTILYSPLAGEVEFYDIEVNGNLPIRVMLKGDLNTTFWFTKDGRHYDYPDGECTLFPSKEQRDWSKFTAPWLEKQGEPNPYSGVSFKYNSHTWGMCARDNGVEILVDGEIKVRIFLDNKPQGKQTNEREWLYLVSDVLTWKDGIGQYLDDPRVQELAKRLCSEYAQKLYNHSNTGKNEQKSADKIEPRFKVGDWVVNKFGDSYHIDSLDKKNYQVSDGKGNYNYFPISKQGEMHLWTIKDGRDGDVLSFYSEYKGNKMVQIGIIEKYVGKYGGCSNTFKVYVGVNWDNNLQMGKYMGCSINMGCSDIHPATKEQRDSLMKAMKESGYEWDADKKELKKLVPNRFDPKTLKPFDKVLVKQCDIWHPDFYSCYIEDDDSHVCSGLKDYYFCIPYNDDTKHLAGTTDEAPEYYRYWED